MYTENYMALLACIISKRQISADSAIRIVLDDKKFGWRSKEEKAKDPRGGNNAIAVELHDTVENKVYRFDSGASAARFIGMNDKQASTYINSEYKYKDRYIFKRVKNTRKYERKNFQYSRVIVTDTLENKEYKFDTYDEAAKFVGMETNNISLYIIRKHKFKNRYEFRKWN